MVALNDSERDENYQQNEDENPDAYQKSASLCRRHVGNVIACQEERYVSGDEDGQNTPPFVNPDERVV